MTTDLTSLTGLIQLAVAINAQKSIDAGVIATPAADIALSKNFPIAFGTGALKADQIFFDRRTLAGAGTEDLDLAGLTNLFGAAITLTKIKALILVNRSNLQTVPSDASMKLIPGSAAPVVSILTGTTPAIVIPSGACLALFDTGADGWAVTATTADKIGITNLDAVDVLEYDIIVVGENA